MKMGQRLTWAGLVLVVTVLGVLAPPVQAAEYTFTDLGTLGGTGSIAFGINASGTVMGAADTTGNLASHFFLYSGGVMQDLGAVSLNVYGINASNQMVGFTRTGTAHAGVYSNGSVLDLGTLVGGNGSYAVGINDSGQVVGYSTTTGNLVRAFRWSGGSLQDIGGLGGTFSNANCINASGQIAGGSYTAGDAAYHACFWSSDGAIQDLGTLAGGTTSEAYGINVSGQVVGMSSMAGNSGGYACLWSGGAVQYLGNLGGTNSAASSINASGQVVGYSYLAGNSMRHAFLYSDGVMTDLNSLLPSGSGWTLTEAKGINDSGQIAGNGYNPAGQYCAFLMTPVPEPITLSILVLGGLTVIRRQKS